MIVDNDFCSFLLVQKRTKKAHPKTMYRPFSGGGLIRLWYYCGFSFIKSILRLTSDIDLYRWIKLRI